MNIKHLKIIKLLKGTLKESKQVGQLYHFTSVGNAMKILNSGTLLKSKKPEALLKVTKNVNMPPEMQYRREYNPDAVKLNFISFTRDKYFHKGERDSVNAVDIAFIVDGDKLSHRYKIIPINMWNLNDPHAEESEERVLLGNKQGIDNFMSYVTGILINKARFAKVIKKTNKTSEEILKPFTDKGLHIYYV